MSSLSPLRHSIAYLRMALRICAYAFTMLAVLSVTAVFADAQTIPTDPSLPVGSGNCNVSPTLFNSFFHSGAAVNGVVDPANSVTFTNNTSLKNCDFYQWAQQMFLWLTSPAPATYGGGGGRIFASPSFYTVSPADASGKRTLIPNAAGRPIIMGIRASQVGVHGLPVIMNKSGQMFEVQPGPLSRAGNPLVLNSAGKQVEVSSAVVRNGQVVLLDKSNKAITAPKLIVPKAQIPVEQLRRIPLVQQSAPPQPLAPREMVVVRLKTAPARVLQKLQPAPVNPNRIAQRFTINGLNHFLNVNGGVIDTEEGQADFPPSALVSQNGSLIYYVTMVNDVMAYFLTGTKNGGITPTPTQFPTTASDLAKITAFASGAAPPNKRTFPDPNALGIEVKSSWVETTGLANASQYITTEAVIPTYDKSNPNKWVPNGQKTTTLALVGMHVVGSANGHAEMIWATFEHFGNSPDATFNYNSTVHGANFNVPQASPIAGTWVFCATGATGPFNPMTHAQLDASGNIIGSPIGPSNILRFKPYGAALGTQPNPLISNDATSNTQIIGLVNSILSDFAALSGGPDIRTNYYIRGATWTEGGSAPTGSFPTGIDVGTSQLANTTMETFQQTTTAFNAFSNNCFSCHATNQLNVSHMACDPSHFPGCVNGIQPLF